MMKRSLKKKVMKRKLESKKISSDCHCIPVSILDELAARFMINIPVEEREDLIRICFQLELAHWFYIDYYLPNNPGLVEGTIQEFAAHMFNHLPSLLQYSGEIESILENWSIYKKSVPVNGAVLLNKQMNKILLVKGFSSKASWTFPKGKINEGEEYHECAVREVLEETGFDISPLIDKDQYLERVINDQTIRLFLVAGVEDDFPFRPRSRGEISEIVWWNLTTLPASLNDKEGTRKRLGLSVHSFYNSIPFIRAVQHWAAELCANQLINSISDQSVNRSNDQSVYKHDDVDQSDQRNSVSNQSIDALNNSSDTDQSETRSDSSDQSKDSTFDQSQTRRTSSDQSYIKQSEAQVLETDQPDINQSEARVSETDQSEPRNQSVFRMFCPQSWTNFKFNLSELNQCVNVF